MWSFNKRAVNYLIVTILVCVALLAGCKKAEENEEGKKATQEIEAEERVEKEEEGTVEENKEAGRDDLLDAAGQETNLPVQKKNILISIDPGHQSEKVDMSALEENAPGGTTMKAKATGGTRGSYTGIPEYQLNLDISLELRDMLVAQGYDVIMTRETNETAISNKERALLANEAGADLSIRIHANGSENHDAHGALVLVGSAQNLYVGNLYEDSYRAGVTILNAYCDRTGMYNRGVQTNDSMTGINWSMVPVIILEMGFMTNEQDDNNMADAAYRSQMVAGIVEGINQYFNLQLYGLLEQVLPLLQGEQEKGGTASMYVADLTSGAELAVNNRQMQSASLIKLFIASCVYEHVQDVESLEKYGGETVELLQRMIRISDNDATNTLIGRLGRGDFHAGMEVINQFCQTHGFTETKIGRLMLESNATADNYTSVRDCGNLLKALYEYRLPGAEPILESMNLQERRAKLPAGVPETIMVGNKTGELENVENDAALVYLDGRPYSVCVMMENLTDTSSARSTMVQLSSIVYQYMNQ